MTVSESNHLFRVVPGRGRLPCRALLAGLALAAAHAQPAQAQMASAIISGSLVNRETRTPVEGARISVMGSGLTVESDSVGRFHISGVAPGVRVVQVRAIGFTVGSWLVQLTEGQVIRHEFEMEPRIYALAEMDVEGTDEFNWRSEAAFELRRASASGFFISRQDILTRRPTNLADLLLGVPGLMTECRGRNCQVTMSRSTRPCTPEYFLDGHPATLSTGANFPIHQIRGVEIYRSQFEAPSQFHRVGMTCGVVAMWTVEPGERLDRPGQRIGQRDSLDARPQPGRRPVGTPPDSIPQPGGQP